MINFLVLITICSLPLYVLRGKIASVPTTYLEVLIGLSIFFWVVRHFTRRGGLLTLLTAFKTPLVLPTLLFLAAGLLSLLFTPDFFKGVGLFRAYLLEPWLLFVISLDVFKKSPHKIFQGLLISGWLVSIVALLQLVTGLSLFEDSKHELSQGRVASVYNSANSLAIYLGPILALLLGSLLKKSFLVDKIWAIPSIFIFLLVVSLTNSLGAFLGLSSVLVLYLFFSLVKDHSALRKVFFKVVLATIVVLSAGYFILLGSIGQFTPQTGLVYPRPFNSTEVVRLCLWEGTRDFLISQPWGGGWSSFPQNYENFRTCDTELFQYPHNLFLNFWTEVGLVGLLAFGYLVFSFVKLVLRSKVERVVKVSLLSFLVYLFIHGLVDVPYFKNDLSAQFWVYLAFGILVTKSEIRISKYETR